MKSIYALITLLLVSLASFAVAADQPEPQPQGGIPVYVPEVRHREVGRLYPTPYVVPTYWRHYNYRPTAVGRAALGPWRVRYSPGPPMLYVPN